MPRCQNSYCRILSSLPYQKTKAAFDDWRCRSQNSNRSSSRKKGIPYFLNPTFLLSFLDLSSRGSEQDTFPASSSCSPSSQPRAKLFQQRQKSLWFARFFVVLFSDKQQSRQLMWDVDSLFVRQGAAATCWHPVMYKWKGFSVFISSHGRFQGWKHIERRWCTSCWAWRNFPCMVAGSFIALLAPMGLTVAHFLLFCLCPSSWRGLLSSRSRARGRPDAFASLKLRDNEKTWVNQIFHNSPSELKSSWNRIFMFRCEQQWDCLREKETLRILLWKHNVLVGLIFMKTIVVAAWYPLKTHAQALTVRTLHIYFVTPSFLVFHSIPFQNAHLAYVAGNIAK